MVLILLVHFLFVEIGLFIEQSLSECMIFLFNSFGFPFSESHIETLRSFFHFALLLINLDMTPFPCRDLNKFVQQNLVISVDFEVLLLMHEFCVLLLLVSHLFQLFFHLLYWQFLRTLCYFSQLVLMLLHLPIHI